MSTIHNYYIYDPAVIDVATCRADAQARLDGTGIHSAHPEESNIHFHHRYVQASTQDIIRTGSGLAIAPCNDQCERYRVARM